jgi:hypothetical protein
VTAPEHQLLALWRRLGSAERATLLAFAEFLEQRAALPEAHPPRATPAAVPEPVAIVRPPGESVVAALKRLARTYPMLDKSIMLRATSDLVARHIMQGTETAATIDELEDIFRDHYRQLVDARGE